MFCRMCGVQMTFQRHWKLYRSVGVSIDFVHRFYSKDLYSVHAKLIVIIGDDPDRRNVITKVNKSRDDLNKGDDNND